MGKKIAVRVFKVIFIFGLLLNLILIVYHVPLDLSDRGVVHRTFTNIFFPCVFSLIGISIISFSRKKLDITVKFPFSNEVAFLILSVLNFITLPGKMIVFNFNQKEE